MRYRNLEPPYEPQPLRSVLKWAVVHKAMGRRREAPPRVLVPTTRPDAALLLSSCHAPSLTWVGHASWIIRLDGMTLFVDPVWSESLGPGLGRNVAPGVSLAEAPLPDAVLITHNHRDHLDEPSVRRIAAEARRRGGRPPTWICGQGLGGFFRRRDLGEVVELPWWGEHTLRDPSPDALTGGSAGRRGPVTVSFVPSQHWSQRGPLDRNESLWGGFVVTGSGRRVYHAGDTAYFRGFEEIGRRYPDIDGAMLPIGAYDPEWFMRQQHMNPEDALRAFEGLSSARLLCAMHWGTFKLTDEPLDEPPVLLEEERARLGVAPEAIWVGKIGESRAL